MERANDTEQQRRPILLVSMEPTTAIVEGERVYDSIPDDLQMQWDHVRVEAAMRNRLKEAQAMVNRLKTEPKTYGEIQQALQDFEAQTMIPDVFSALFGALHPTPPSGTPLEPKGPDNHDK